MIRIDWPNRQTLVIAAIAAVVVIGAAIGLWRWQSARAQEAAFAYSVALGQAQAARSAQATPEVRAQAAQVLEDVLKRYPSAPLAAQAAYDLGNLRNAQGQYAAARSAYEIVVARTPSPTLEALARLGIGYSWEAERNFDRARVTFESLAASRKPSDPFYEETLMDLARAEEEAGKKDAAVATYKRLLKDVPSSRAAADVRARLAALGATP